MKPIQPTQAQGTLVRSLLTLAGGAATLPLLVSPADASILVDTTLNGTVIGWNTGLGQMPSVTGALLPGGAAFNLWTRANATGGSSSSSVGVGARNVSFRRGGLGHNPAYLATFGAGVAAGIGVATFGNINLGNISSASDKGNAAFSGPPSKYLLFKFTNTDTSMQNYGWIELKATTTGFSSGKSAYSATLGNWAYDNSGVQITAGAVPEPSTLSLLGGALVAGAIGLRRWRKQRATSGHAHDPQA